MKILGYAITFVLIIISSNACKKKDNIADSLDDFCAVIPEGWKCEIISANVFLEYSNLLWRN